MLLFIVLCFMLKSIEIDLIWLVSVDWFDTLQSFEINVKGV